MKQPAPIVLTLDSLDEKILQALFFYHYLSAIQVTRLFYSPGSLKWVKKRLKILEDKAFIQTVKKYPDKPLMPYVYTLHGLGVRHLKSLGLETERYFRPYKQAIRSDIDLKHTLSVNDFCIAAEVLERIDSRVQRRERFHDLVLKTQPCEFPITIKDAHGHEIARTGRAVPDAWLDYSVSRGEDVKPRRFSLWIEQDNATQGEKPIRAKVRNLLLLYKTGAYTKHFHSKALTVCFVTIGDERRVAKLREWMRSELLLHPKEAASASRMFLITHLTPPIAPQSVFFEPVWLHPFGDDRYVTLFDLS